MFGIISLAILFIGIKYRKYFLLLAPFLQYAGLIFLIQKHPPNMNFIINYAELLILIIFSLSYKLKGKIPLFLFLYPLLSIPSLLFARDHLFHSIFLMLLLSLSSFLYLFYLKNMEWMLKKNIFNLSVLLWTSFGFLIKIYEAIKWAPTLAPDISTGEFMITFRGGGLGSGMFGSNHAAGILFLFLPFIENPWILIFSNLYLLLTFSRGIYALLILFWIIKVLIVISHSSNRIKIVKSIALTCAVLSLIWVFLPISYKNLILDLAFLRVFGSGIYFGNTLKDMILNKTLADPRIDIWVQAITMFKKTLFQGVGLGGFYWGQGLIGATQEFSNAHNLYLTLIVEGGVYFFIAFSCLLVYMFSLAKRYSNPALISLIFFTIYGFYSGEIYSTNKIASANNYYYLIFLLAYLKWRTLNYSIKSSA